MNTTIRTRSVRAHSSPGCDFCAAPLGTRPYSRFGCRDFVHTSPTPTGGCVPVVFVGLWAACRRCAPLVRDRRWPALADRCIAAHRAAGGRAAELPEVRSELGRLWLRLEREFTGDETVGRHCR